jgi:transposase-like protein
MRHDRAFWSKAVNEVERGGNLERVARRLGVRPKTLDWWRWRLGAERVAPKKNETRVAPKRKETRLVPIVVESLPIASDATIEIAIRDVCMRVVSGTDVRYVAALIDAVRAC